MSEGIYETGAVSKSIQTTHQLIAGSWWEGRPIYAHSHWETGSMTAWENSGETVEPDQSRKLVQEEDCDSIYSAVVFAMEI